MLRVPLTQEQVDAANRFHASVGQWRRDALALEWLAKLAPGWSYEECLVKCATINSLYSTRVLAIARMAQHVERVFSQTVQQNDFSLVDALAGLAYAKNKKPRRYLSFASKLCHVFVSHERFPIYDSLARQTLALHLGKAHGAYSNYRAFCEKINALITLADIQPDYRSLDRYLWLVGLYRLAQQGGGVHTAFSDALRSLSQEQAKHLHAFLPAGIVRDF